MRTEYDRGIMVEMMERFPNPNEKADAQAPETLSASELADVLRASSSRNERVETGAVNVEELRSALENARRNPVTI